MTGKPNPSEGMGKWRVSADEAGMRLLAFLREKNPDAPSVKTLKRAIDAKYCTVNGQTETFSTRLLKKDDIVTLQAGASDKAVKLSLPVLYEDEDLILVDKPVGLVCENRLVAPLLTSRAVLIHRLDKETSGVLILAKNDTITEQMIGLFRDKSVHKRYLALVDGDVLHAEGKIDKGLRIKSRLQGQTIYEAASGGQPALTLWKRLTHAHGASLLLCEPVTGRTHQLRVHLSSMGHPILGDTQYGKRFRCQFRPRRQMLHAYSISFIHPKTQREIKVTAPIPQDFKNALEALKLVLP